MTDILVKTTFRHLIIYDALIIVKKNRIMFNDSKNFIYNIFAVGRIKFIQCILDKLFAAFHKLYPFLSVRSALS